MDRSPTALVLLFAIAVLLLGCAPQATPSLNEPPAINPPPAHPAVPQGSPDEGAMTLPRGEEVTLVTSDRARISGTIYPSNSSEGIVLLPMLRHDRTSYAPIIPQIAKTYAAIAIDLRGHGKSSGDLSTFGPNDFAAMKNDAEAAIKALGKDRVAIIGASIGANAGLLYASRDPRVKGVILLSPGLEYRGLAISDAMKSYRHPSLLVATRGDEYSYMSVQNLGDSNDRATVQVYPGQKHGTDMLGQGNALENLILQKLDEMMGRVVDVENPGSGE